MVGEDRDGVKACAAGDECRGGSEEWGRTRPCRRPGRAAARRAGSLAALGASLLLALSACGGSGSPSGSSQAGSSQAGSSESGSSESEGSEAAASLPSGTLAEVGNEAITKAEFEHQLRITVAQRTHVPAAEAPIPVPPHYAACIANLQESENGSATHTQQELMAKCKERYRQDSELALSTLVGNAWLTSEAAERGLKVTKAETEKRFEELRKEKYPTDQAFKEYLAANGYTRADLMAATRVELLRTDIEKQILSDAETNAITDKEVAAFYKSHTKDTEIPKERKVRVLLTSSQAKATAAKAQIESGQSFASVAKRVSIYHAAGGGGSVMEAVPGHDAESLESVVWTLKPHVLTGPVQTPQGFFVLEVLHETPGHIESLKQAGKSIRYAIRKKRTENAVKDFPNEFNTRWKARTTCRPSLVIAQCKEFHKKTTSSPLSAG